MNNKNILQKNGKILDAFLKGRASIKANRKEQQQIQNMRYATIKETVLFDISYKRRPDKED